MRFPDRAEIATGLLVLGVSLTGCAKNVPLAEISPTAKPSPVSLKVPTVAATPTPDKKARGKQLASLDLSKSPGERLQPGESVKIEEFISVLSTGKENLVMLNSARLLALSKECGFPETGRFFAIEIRDKYPESGESAFDIKYNDKVIRAIYGMRMLYSQARIDLLNNFEVESSSMVTALENLTNLHMNRLLSESTCGLAAASRKSKDNLTEQEAIAAMREASQISVPYSMRILTGIDVPVLRVLPKLKISSS